MNRLAVQLNRLQLANPILVASGTFGYAREAQAFVDFAALGGIIPKTITPQPRIGNPPPRTVETSSGLLNSIGLDNDGLEQFIEKHGEVYPLKDDKGTLKYLQQFPQVAIAHKLATHLTRLEQEFGMTPSSRSRIRIERDEQVDEFETFLQANRA